MTRSPGLVALTRRRFATPRSAATVIVALTLLAAFLVAAAPRALVDVLHRQVAFQIQQLSPAARDLTATVWEAPPSFGADSEGADDVFGALVESLTQLRSDAGDTVVSVISDAEFYLYGGAFEVFADHPDPRAPRTMMQFLTDPGMQENLRLVEGQWPAPRVGDGPLQMVMTVEVAERLGWEIGEVRRSGPWDKTVAAGTPARFPVELSGIVEHADAGASRWEYLIPAATVGTLFDDGNSRPSVTGGGYVAPESWPATPAVGRTVLSIWYPLDPGAVVAAEPAQLLKELRGLSAQSSVLGDENTVRARFGSDVVSALDLALQRSHATTATLAVAAVGPIAVSIALIVLAAGLVVHRRRGDLLLLSARGATKGRLRRLLLLEGIILGVVPAVAAACAAVLAFPSDAGFLPTALAVVIGLVPALALSSSLTSGVLSQERTDLGGPARSKWVGLVHVLVVLLAALAVGLLVSRGVGRASAGVDPLVVIAPLLATVALGLIAVRLHPLWLRAALARAQRGRGAVAFVGAARSLREPAAGSTAVLAMLVAVAIAVFSSIVLATVDRGAVASAERATGGDISISGPVFDGDAIHAIASVDGVAQVAAFAEAGRAQISTAQGQQSVAVFVADMQALSLVQSGLSEGLPSTAVTVGAQPSEVLASAAVVDEVGTGVATSGLGEMRITGALDVLPGAGSETSFIVIDVDDYAALTDSAVAARTVFVSLRQGADAAEVAAGLREAVGSSSVLRTLDSRIEAMQSSPAVSALRSALLAALVLAVLLSVVAVLLVSGVSRHARSRVVALMRTVGAGTKEARGLISWEFAPLGISALIGGLALGVALPLLVLASVDLRPFTGGRAQPGLTIDPLLTTGLVVVVAVSLVLAVLAGVLTARTTSLVTVLRSQEDR